MLTRKLPQSIFGAARQILENFVQNLRRAVMRVGNYNALDHMQGRQLRLISVGERCGILVGLFGEFRKIDGAQNALDGYHVRTPFLGTEKLKCLCSRPGTHLPDSPRDGWAGREHSSSIGCPGLYSSFFGGSHPCSCLSNRVGLPASSLSALAAMRGSASFISVNAEVCVINSDFAGKNKISRCASTIL